MGVKFGTEEGTFGPLLRAKFHPHPCNVSPLRGEKPQNRPLSKLNTGRFALRAMLPVMNSSQASSPTCLSRDCLETWFFISRSWLSLDTRMSCLGSVLSFRVSSCLMSHDCVLTVSLSTAGVVKCLFCAETLAFQPKVGQTHVLAVYLP